MGRGVETFSISRAMALASKMPTQIGRKWPFSGSRRITTGMFETGSMRSPLISILIMRAAFGPMRRGAPISELGSPRVIRTRT